MSEFYFTKEHVKKHMNEWKTLEEDSLEYHNTGMMLIVSFGKKLILTEWGILRGIELYNKFKMGEDMTRNEMMEAYLLSTEASLITGEPDSQEISVKIYDKLASTYNPDVSYLKEYMSTVLKTAGYVKDNDNFIPEVQRTLVGHTKHNNESLKEISIYWKLEDEDYEYLFK